MFTVQALFSLRPEPSVPTAKAIKQHRLGKRREREAPVSKHQIRPGNGSRTGRRGSGMPNPHCENNISCVNGDSPTGKGTLPIKKIPHAPPTPISFSTTGQQYRQTSSFVYIGGAITESSRLSAENDRRIRAGWMSFNRYRAELYDRPRLRST